MEKAIDCDTYFDPQRAGGGYESPSSQAVGPGPISQPAGQQTGLMRLGIVVAMPAEARSLTKRRLALGEQIQLQENISLHLSGVGPKRARRAAEALLEKGCTALLSWGIAGGLAPGLSPGSLVLPKWVIAADEHTYDVDPRWHDLMVSRLSGQLDLHTEALAESPGVLASPTEKKVLFRRTSAVAVDMESAAVARVAQAGNISFMAVRAISDPVDSPIPKSALVAFSSSGRLSVLRLLKGLVEHPTDLFDLVRLGLNTHAAHATLMVVARSLSGTLLIR